MMAARETGPKTASINPALLDALERLRGTGPEFGGFLANHAPMAAEALTILGRSDQLPTWVDHYKTRLTHAPQVRRGIATTEWREHLGNVDLAGDWRELIGREAMEMPWRDLLSRWWDRLLPGLAASATHGVIRTAHAVRSLAAADANPGDPTDNDLTGPGGLLVDEPVQGLALWAARYQLLPGAPHPNGPLTAVAATAAMPRLPASIPSRGPGVFGRLAALVDLPGFPSALNEWGAAHDPDSALDELISAAALVVAARDDAPVALCHTVTAPAAIRMVLPHLPSQLRGPSVAAAWQAMAGLISAFASPRLETESALAGPLTGEELGGRADRPEDVMAPVIVDTLVDRAAWHGDEHVIKLTEAAVREYERHADSVVLVAAERFHHRIPRET